MVSDVSDSEPVVILDLDKLKDSPKSIRIDAFWWLIEEKMGLRLWWCKGNLLIPMESRNSIRFDTPLAARDYVSDKWERKLYVSTHDVGSNTTKQKYFAFGLDMEKS